VSKTAIGLTMAAVGLVGLFVAPMLSIFVFSQRDAYGTLEMPGSEIFHFPSGGVHVNYEEHTGGRRISAPRQLAIQIQAVDGGGIVSFSPNSGATSNTTNVSRVGLGSFESPADGAYRVTASAPATGPQPALTFGKSFWSAFLSGVPLIIVLCSAGLVVLGVVVSVQPVEKVPTLE
jgi:hypothetical protein